MIFYILQSKKFNFMFTLTTAKKGDAPMIYDI